MCLPSDKRVAGLIPIVDLNPVKVPQCNKRDTYLPVHWRVPWIRTLEKALNVESHKVLICFLDFSTSISPLDLMITIGRLSIHQRALD